MTKPLAQMTGKEREACIGMWCDCGSRLRPAVLVYMGHRRGYFISPASGTEFTEALTRVTPRFDLPRAWNPDGTPPKGEWAEGHMWWGEDTDTMQTVDIVGAECLTTGEIQGLEEWPEGVTPGEDVPVRRFISEWEPIP